MTSQATAPRRFRVAALIVAASAALVFANSLTNDFAYDDRHQLLEHDRIHTLSGTLDALDEPYWPGGEIGRKLGLWRPLTTLSYGIGWWAFEGRAIGFHLLNVLLHILVSVMVLALFWRLLAPLAALLAGVLFAVHPVHVEAVANTVGLAELLSAGISLIAILLFLRWTDGEAAMGGGGYAGGGGKHPVSGLTLPHIAALCGLFLLALFAKEGAIVLPALIVVLDLARREERISGVVRYIRERWALLGGLTLTAIALMGMRWRVLGSIARPEPPTGAEALLEIPSIWTAAGVWPHYLRLLVFPRDLSADYAPGVVPIRYGWDLYNAAGAGLAILVMLVALVAWRRRRPGGGGSGLVTVGILWFVLAMLPVANLFFVSGVLLAERTLYLPSVGFLLAAGWVIEVADRRLRVPRERALALGAALLVIGLLSIRTVTRNPVWKDNDTLFTTLMLEHPESGRSQWVIANALLQVGDLDGAVRGFLQARALFGWPGNYVLEFEAGQKLLEVGRTRDAIGFLEAAAALDPAHPDPLRLLGVAHQGIQDWAGAEGAAERLLALDPSDGAMHHLLATALEEQGRPGEAIPHRRRAIELDGAAGWRPWLWLAGAQRAAGAVEDACIALDSAQLRTELPAERLVLDSLRSGLGGCR